MIECARVKPDSVLQDEWLFDLDETNENVYALAAAAASRLHFSFAGKTSAAPPAAVSFSDGALRKGGRLHLQARHLALAQNLQRQVSVVARRLDDSPAHLSASMVISALASSFFAWTAASRSPTLTVTNFGFAGAHAAGDALELGEAAVHGCLPALEAGAHARAAARLLAAHSVAARATLSRAVTATDALLLGARPLERAQVVQSQSFIIRRDDRRRETLRRSHRVHPERPASVPARAQRERGHLRRVVVPSPSVTHPRNPSRASPIRRRRRRARVAASIKIPPTARASRAPTDAPRPRRAPSSSRRREALG